MLAWRHPLSPAYEPRFIVEPWAPHGNELEYPTIPALDIIQ
jgi:hypothetical protein